MPMDARARKHFGVYPLHASGQRDDTARDGVSCGPPRGVHVEC
jgi:hypothetical protein